MPSERPAHLNGRHPSRLAPIRLISIPANVTGDEEAQTHPRLCSTPQLVGWSRAGRAFVSAFPCDPSLLSPAGQEWGALAWTIVARCRSAVSSHTGALARSCKLLVDKRWIHLAPRPTVRLRRSLRCSFPGLVWGTCPGLIFRILRMNPGWTVRSYDEGAT